MTNEEILELVMDNDEWLVIPVIEAMNLARKDEAEKQSIDKELAGKIWDASEKYSENMYEYYEHGMEIISPDKETFINSLNLDNTQIRDVWVRVEDRLPNMESEKFSDSDYVLCVDINGSKIPFVAWYNHKTMNWTVSHSFASSNPATVTHWQLLPTTPND